MTTSRAVPGKGSAGGDPHRRRVKEVSMMARSDVYLDAMLRHLGAAYYESLHGRATRLIWDVDGVVDVVNKITEIKAAKEAPRPDEAAGPEVAQTALTG
jgi:hypothetical protein